jgi:phosphatidylglycerol:prolipoprotein diacylglycerol transferase
MGLDATATRDIALLCLVVGLVGSHVLYLAAYEPQLLIERPSELLRVGSGISSFGGFFSAALAVWLYLRYRRLPFLPYADAIVFGLVPGWLLGRLGCFTAHDHIGATTTFPLAVQFPSGTRHDLGLYEAAITLGLTIVLYGVLGPRARAGKYPDGFALAIIMIAYGVIRFFLDTLRATDISGADARYLGLTPAQYACVLVVVSGTGFLWRLRRSHPPAG